MSRCGQLENRYETVTVIRNRHKSLEIKIQQGTTAKILEALILQDN